MSRISFCAGLAAGAKTGHRREQTTRAVPQGEPWPTLSFTLAPVSAGEPDARYSRCSNTPQTA
jgi:hypothetical protein